MSTVLHSVRLVDDGAETPDAWVRFDGGRVVATGAGATWEAADTVVDGTELAGPGAILTPGFVDLHTHGGGGRNHDEGADAVRTARAVHRAHGTTRAVVSLVTASVDDLAERVTMIAGLAASDPDVLGSHLEGPFLDPGHKGAHTEGLLRAPGAEDVTRLIAAGRGTIRQITLAPELEGATAAIERLRAAGTVVALGHTDADADAARSAFDAGATLLTHAFNAMRGIHHRAPGPVVAALRDDRVVLEVIADGVHVDLGLVAVLFDAAPGRIALVTDAMAAAGAPDGSYELGGLAVTVQDGVARLARDGAIAGSTLTQDVALRRVVSAGVALPVAVAALTRTPARVLGMTDIGSLAVGARADAVLLTAGLDVRSVWIDGAHAS
ncbi:N-acetylglucosamine-6-phosphate deacetylase [Microbacterium thalassium]|uniref:N-acetylglucosamine-6-phosphate deacetylase n=1 Tax=Microbacterium thalassium TaxID=362649 RepID=A0A7X0KUI8_9MICO|nr:N-acetylglucosamine-6-phosphate deacetylase [Microbacterium thalassium]MBB6391216.1 N-acetylglucosamine-6-phosphate deacetylase [Microbacterium thalassium]GLK23673.1 N-acetylglucosamine-6-phosphate deacetylase [Microbacterium thalassium]